MSENNLALYRKYRPDTFAKVIGQDHIVSILESSVKNDKVSHAYLFVGSRGTGKTSVARIFAEQIGVTKNDLYEIDAASNRGIEDIKELRDGVRVLPFDSKYKIYIIDEVHMLSKDAWGALLKTLEEPPKHVIFILATTELHKVPETIISRCQVFNFKKASDVSLKNILHDVAKKEGFTLEAGVAELLAILADGSFRDGLGVLQKVLNFSTSKNKKITKEEVEKITGTPKTVLVNNFISAIAHEDVATGIETVEKANEENLDMKLFLKLIILKFRMAVVLRYAPKLEAEMRGDLSDEDLIFLKNLIKEDTKGMLRSKALSVLLNAYADIDNAFINGLPIELAIIKILEQDKE
ncbi:MAG: polymerase III gamma and tau subunit protein [Candidatus Nomurabacteria bacterium GW2011_GWA2_40_9]|uniref:DNA polymerase III subunit gamma/tau n=1 Tax=Candidatus Nomurabacteria bacterium GW2011_GWA2_40_9 TaxID=1618734 RepID=A0A0G0TXA4_9BACT|nr:MAG: polymerase III gamma and tau subunit protein [Candidatus Nomurabacteria bacterium GW2011_GWA2_40_9]